ncbi:MAG TPA: alcohol dehydrogenase, partial [Candidatus Nitrosopelagicus sp.]|nr:alcohol dehydrogenase [Candidatus Nitrosopelagicus sp.]
EFLRVSGFEELSPKEVEAANNEIVGLLGEDDETIKAGIKSAAQKLGKQETTLTNLLDKVKTIAEKIQKNTSTMIPDQQFLSQEQVAIMVLTLADDELSKILNGKIIPGDRVFYPVKPHIASSVPKLEKNNLDGKPVYITGDDPRIDSITSMINEKGGHITASEGKGIDLFIYFTGNIPNFSKLTELSRGEWNKLVDQFINVPAAVTQKAISAFVPGGSDDPRKFKDAKGRIVIIGPALPSGKKISGHEMAKVEVFRGALRPFVTTINQELSDVLKSNVRVFLILPGTVDGKEPNNENIVNTINYLMSDEAGSSSEVIFCPDETR